MATNSKHPAQTIEGAKRAAAILQAQPDPTADGETVYLDFGAGLALSIGADSTFTLAGLKRDGRELLELTAEETHALYSFWLNICAQVVVDLLPEAVAHVKTQRPQEGDCGNV